MKHSTLSHSGVSNVTCSCPAGGGHVTGCDPRVNPETKKKKKSDWHFRVRVVGCFCLSVKSCLGSVTVKLPREYSSCLLRGKLGNQDQRVTAGSHCDFTRIWTAVKLSVNSFNGLTEVMQHGSNFPQQVFSVSAQETNSVSDPGTGLFVREEQREQRFLRGMWPRWSTENLKCQCGTVCGQGQTPWRGQQQQLLSCAADFLCGLRTLWSCVSGQSERRKSQGQGWCSASWTDYRIHFPISSMRFTFQTRQSPI